MHAPMIELTPLERLSPAVDRVAGEKSPLALKLMAARGLAPLGPADLATAIYQLAQSDDETVKQAALKTAVELPEKILGGALAEALDARVLDFFARRSWQKPRLLEILLLNRATDDRTYRHLATLAGENDLELIAKNDERLLRHPEIIAALYMNPKTRMSTVQRAIELAVRNNVKVEGIPAFEEAARAIAESGAKSAAQLAAEDAAFKKAAEIIVDPAAALMMAAIDEKEKLAQEEAEARQAEELAENGAEKEEEKKQLKDLNVAAKIRAATLGNAFARAVLIRDTIKQVSMACIRSPGVTDAEAMHYAGNRALDDDIIRYIANNRAWVRLYGIKVALLNNPKCPMNVSMRLLPHLNIRDLKNLARSKGIPSALANAAKNMLAQRNV
jgi:hypothetical protein